MENKKKELNDTIKELNGLSDNIIRFPAVDGNELTDSQIKRVVSLKTYSDLDKPRENHEVIFNKPSLGCYLSHISIYQEMLKNNYDWILIVEDDVKLNAPHFKREFNKLVSKISPDTEVILLGYTMLRHSPKIGNGYYIIDGLFWGTHCYLINRNGARKLLEKCYPAELQIDAYIGTMSREVNIVAPYHPLATQRLHHSSIQNLDIKSFMPRDNYKYFIILMSISAFGYYFYYNKKC